MMQEHQIKILMLMHDLEKTLGEIYEMFSERFPDHNNLWDILIKEEKAHAEAIRDLYKLTYEGKALFDEGKIKAQTVQSVLDYVTGIYDNAKSGKYTEIQALAITYDLERSMLEKDIFEHFDVSPEFARVLNMLNDETHDHVDICKKELDRMKK